MSARTHPSSAINTAPFFGYQLRKFALIGVVTLFACIVLSVYLLPFANMAMVALSSQEQLSQSASESVIPTKPVTFTYEGKEYPIYKLETEEGTKRIALIKPGRRDSDLIDVDNVEAGVFNWEGNWRTLESTRVLSLEWSNFGTAWNAINFPRLFTNTLIIAVAGMVGTLISSVMVGYAFARFPIPGKNILFIILIGTIILPSQVTLIPTYAFFAAIGWTNSWLPLIVPHFFANAYNVFLLRQYFMTLPRELDEAAMIDGAGPLQILLRVILPQSWPVIIAVAVFHFVWAWNDYFGPLIYLIGKPELQPVSVGVQIFNFQYGPRPELVQATSMMALVLPLIIFFLAQRAFMRGVVVTGVDK